MSYWHWRCECGALGNSNDFEAIAVIIGLHQDKGHTVTSGRIAGWSTTHAQVFEGIDSEDTPT